MLSDRSQADTTGGSPMRARSHPGWTFAIVSVALFMVVLDNLVVTNALPSIRLDLGATIGSLEWTVNAYTLAYAVLLLMGAALGDRFGRRRMFLAGLAVFTGASRSARGLASPGWAWRSGRSWAAPSSRACRGTGSSGSASPSASPCFRWPRA